MDAVISAPEVPKTVKLPAELWAELEAVIAEEDTDFSKICRKALRIYLDRLTDRQEAQ